MPTLLQTDEADDRIEQLAAACVIDSTMQRDLDLVARLASHVGATRAAMIHLADGPRLRVRSAIGLRSARDIRCAAAFCAYTMEDLRLVETRDAFADPSLRELRVVRGEPGIRFHCGIPLLSGGSPIGALSVFDPMPRELAIEHHWALCQLAELAALLLAPRVAHTES